MALQHAWRQAGHGELIGVAHTTALFWSTRLFKDPRDMWTAEGEAPMPWPDRLAVNGPAMRLVCARRLATRLLGWSTPRPRYFSVLGGRQAPEPRSSVHVLLGEYLLDADRHLLEVGTALDNIDLSLDVAVRPPPCFGTTTGPGDVAHACSRGDAAGTGAR